MEALDSTKIVLLGKSGSGKSSLANFIIEENIFQVNKFNDSAPCSSQSFTKDVHGRRLTLIDTPGMFDMGRSKEEVKGGLLSCLIECSPGPHVFLVIFKVERFTEQEEAVVQQFLKDFSEDALKHSIVVFTRGDQLQENTTIKEYIGDSEGLKELVRKCGDRCHVFDNKYWNTNTMGENRNNQFHLLNLLKSINQVLSKNDGRFYTNKKLREIEKEIQQAEENMRLLKGLTREEGRKKAKEIVLKKMTETPKKGWYKTMFISGVILGLAGIIAWFLNYKKNLTAVNNL